LNVLNKKNINLLLRISISLGLLFYLFKTQNIKDIQDNLKLFDIKYLYFAFISLLIGTYLSAIRWNMVLKAFDKKVSNSYLFGLYIKGYFFNNFLPTGMGGDFYKAISIGDKIEDKSIGFFSTFIERFSGLIALAVLSLYSISSYFGFKGLLLGSFILFIGLILYPKVLNIFSTKIKFLNKINEANKILLKDKKLTLAIMASAFSVQIFSIALTYLLFLGFNTNIDHFKVVSLVPLSALSILIPSIGGFGTQDFTYKNLFSLAGMTPAISLGVSVMNHILRLMMSLIGGILLIFKK